MILAFVSATVVFLVAQYSSVQNPLKTDRWFTKQSLGSVHRLFDIGVVDVNNDGRLDIFTANHNNRQLLLINRSPSGEFSDQLLQKGLAQRAEFPGMTFGYLPPSIEDSGLYIYFNKNDLVIQAHNISDVKSVSGKIQLPKSNVASVETKGNLKVSTNDQNRDIEFIGQGNCQLIIKFREFFASPAFALNQHISLEQVYVGPNRVRPKSHNFKVSGAKDRHGLVWADYNSDGRMDVFIARGGAKGSLTQESTNNIDELLIQNNFGFTNQTNISGIKKNTCPGRQVGSVDFDADNQLDIYLTCGRGEPPRQLFPNQLHSKNSSGAFINVATEKGLDILEEGIFAWVDVDVDGDVDLFYADQKKSEFWLYINQPVQFEPRLIGQNLGGISQLSVADYDLDGDLDIFAASVVKNFLLTNVRGIYKISEPKLIGLPAKSYVANWVDYDNDGLTDLYAFPDGLYQQTKNNRFKQTKLLESRYFMFNSLLRKVRNRWVDYYNPLVHSVWFDADNDGSRDLLIALKQNSFEWVPKRVTRIWSQNTDSIRSREPQWDILLYRNIGTKDHWLQLQLIGPQGNLQAIGARVEVKVPTGFQMQQVGQSDDSRYSQGHYRMYFGLGKFKRVNSLKIFWPDGHLQELKQTSSDQLLITRRD